MTAIKLIISGVLFIGAWVLFYYAPAVSAFQGVLFFCGILAMALAFMLPLNTFSKSSSS